MFHWKILKSRGLRGAGRHVLGGSGGDQRSGGLAKGMLAKRATLPMVVPVTVPSLVTSVAVPVALARRDGGCAKLCRASASRAFNAYSIGSSCSSPSVRPKDSQATTHATASRASLVIARPRSRRRLRRELRRTTGRRGLRPRPLHVARLCLVGQDAARRVR